MVLTSAVLAVFQQRRSVDEAAEEGLELCPAITNFLIANLITA
jgi:hypothetical protein